ALVMILTLGALDGHLLERSGPVRGLQYGLAGLGAVGWAAILTIWIGSSIQTSRQRAQSEAERQAEQAESEAEWAAKQAREGGELEKRAAALPLDQWGVQTHLQYSEKHRARAAELIAQRPNLVAELSEMLGREDPMLREYANDYTRRLKPPPAGLIPAL